MKQELLGLMRVPGMNASRARALFRAGIKDPESLAVAEPATLEKALSSSIAKQLKGRGGSSGKGKVSMLCTNHAAAGRQGAEATV